MHPTASLLVQLGIAAVALSVISLITIGYARVAGAAGQRTWPLAFGLFAWALGSFALARTGVLNRWDLRPPPLLPLLPVSLISTWLLARSRIGSRLAAGLPLAALVGFQFFRLPLELFMHAAAREGTMPTQMSFGAGGCNYDILSGASALVLALLLWRGRASRGLVLAWNALAMGLLLVIVSVAVLSTPMFALFGPARLNTWIAWPPFVWMVTVNVPAALFGHLVLLRRLSSGEKV